jgi:hypothetical protein
LFFQGRDAISSFARSLVGDNSTLAGILSAESPSFPLLPENSLVEAGVSEPSLMSEQESEMMACEELLRKLVLAEPSLLKTKEKSLGGPSISGAKLINFIKRLWSLLCFSSCCFC